MLNSDFIKNFFPEINQKKYSQDEESKDGQLIL